MPVSHPLLDPGAMPRHKLPPLLGLLPVLALVACPSEDYVELYASQPIAPSLSPAAVEGLEHLGPTRIDQGVNFGVYSERAERIDLLLFDDPESDRPSREFTMSRFGDVWNVYVEGVGLGQHYGFRAWGPNWPVHPDWTPGRIDGFLADVDEEGNRFNPNKLLMDPYAKALHRDHDWSKGSTASGPKRTGLTYAAAAKGVVVESTYEWSEGEAAWREGRKNDTLEGHRWEDQVVYEVHVKGFTMDPASGVDHPGTYRGFGEKAAYLKELGITAVELLPIHEKPLDGGYWGYQTLNFFAPELAYSSRKEPGGPTDEFKWMVDQLHQHGIEVIVDVVYNHTGEGGLWRSKLELNDTALDLDIGQVLNNFDPYEVAGLYSYRGLDNAAYYALPPGDKKQYWNDTGVGNQTRTNHRPMRRLIMDSLRYYVEELHVDGFRFDLAPILGEVETEAGYAWAADPRQTVLQDIADDPVLQAYNTRVIAEPWSLAGFYLGGFPAATAKEGTGWGEWNGRFRDWWRRFVNEDGFPLSGTIGDADGGFVMTGSDRYFAHNGRRPYHSLNFVTVHDGFTLFDLMSYDQKQNKCGPLNPICCEDPLSVFCDRDSGESNNHSRKWGDERGDAFRRQMIRNMLTAMFISHGTPLLLGGDEWMRTQLGNNNAYTDRSDNEHNWFKWGEWQPHDDRWRMVDFVSELAAIRRKHRTAFAPTRYGSDPISEGRPRLFAWKNAQNGEPPNWGGRNLMIHYYEDPQLVVLINMELGPVDFRLPDGVIWTRLVDTQALLDEGEQVAADPRESQNATLEDGAVIDGGVYGVPERTIVILEALE